jgi:hypothetical protein
VWLGRLLAEVLNKEAKEDVLRVDNKYAISLIKNPVLNDRSRHIDTRYNLIRDYEANGQIKMQFIRTDEQLGDIFTKSLSRVKFQEVYTKIGLCNSTG